MNKRAKLIIAILVTIVGLFASFSGNFLLPPTRTAMTAVTQMPAPQQTSSNVLFFDNFQEDTAAGGSDGQGHNIGVAGLDPRAPWPPAGYSYLGGPSDEPAFIPDGRTRNDLSYPWSPPMLTYNTAIGQLQAWVLASGDGKCDGVNWPYVDSNCSGFGYPPCDELPTGGGPNGGVVPNPWGGCVDWDDQGTQGWNGPNSIMAISKDEHTADTDRSLLVGNPDNYDKTDVSIRMLGATTLPSSGYLTLSYAIWISQGAYAGRMDQFLFGPQLLISLSSGDWSWESSNGDWGQYPMSADNWHYISVTVNLAGDTWYKIGVDGNPDIFPAADGTAIPGFGVHFGWWLNIPGPLNGANDGHSIYTTTKTGQAVTQAQYFYLDDVSLTLSGAPPTTSTGTLPTTSSTPTSSTFPTTSCCTTSTGGITSGQIVWKEDFETGDNSAFNAGQSIQCTNGVIGVSSLNPPTNGAIVHSGNYAGYYYGEATGSTKECHVAPVLNLTEGLTDFYMDSWIYVILPPSGYGGWISVVTMGNYLASQTFQPFTIDVETNGDFQLSNIYDGARLLTDTPMPIDQWFELSLIAHGVGSSSATLEFYLNGQPLVGESGDVAPGPFTGAHWGLLMQGTQPSLTVYNDDIVIEALSSPSGTTSTSMQTSTSSNTSTSSQTTSTVTSTVTSTGSPTTIISTITTGGSTSLTTITSTAPGGTTTLTTTQTGSPTTVTSTIISTVTTTGSSSNQTSTETSTQTSLTTTTLISTLTSNQTFATTTTFTVTGISSEVSYSFTTLTVTGQSISSVATTSTMILLTTASVLTTTTQTAVTTTNLLGASVNSAGQATNGISPTDVLGLVVTFLLLALMLVRRILS